jgi:hypothetical protein
MDKKYRTKEKTIPPLAWTFVSFECCCLWDGPITRSGESCWVWVRRCVWSKNLAWPVLVCCDRKRKEGQSIAKTLVVCDIYFLSLHKRPELNWIELNWIELNYMRVSQFSHLCLRWRCRANKILWTTAWIEAAITSETLVADCLSTWLQIPE